jgi:hypothetical protein
MAHPVSSEQHVGIDELKYYEKWAGRKASQVEGD